MLGNKGEAEQAYQEALEELDQCQEKEEWRDVLEQVKELLENNNQFPLYE